MDYGKLAVELHRRNRGKIRVQSKVSLTSPRDLSVAYTPGVAQVSLEVARNPELVYELTDRGNAVAIITDGSAVLGLGDVGPEAAMPVMEGKALLFRELAGIDAWPLCLSVHTAPEIALVARSVAPSFGGINLEDIAAPKCFHVEEALQDLDIPVFHDDQHGTAIVVLAALTNALQVVGKAFSELKVVFSGAGAGGIACARLLHHVGVRNMVLVDTHGTIYRGRDHLTPVKEEVALWTNPEGIKGGLAQALQGADVFIGLSAGGLLSGREVASMARDPIIFALANPTPEIMPQEALEAGARVVGTGRSDLPNQINNVLAFPGVFRGALDVRATAITTDMKVAAARAIAGLVARPTPEGILPHPLDPAVVPAVAQAVAAAWREGASDHQDGA